MSAPLVLDATGRPFRGTDARMRRPTHNGAENVERSPNGQERLCNRRPPRIRTDPRRYMTTLKRAASSTPATASQTACRRHKFQVAALAVASTSRTLDECHRLFDEHNSQEQTLRDLRPHLPAPPHLP